MQQAVLTYKNHIVPHTGGQKFPVDIRAEREEIRAYNQHLLEQRRALLQACRDARAAGRNRIDFQPFDYSFPSDALARYARDFKLAIRPMEAQKTPLVRLGSANDGGYVMLDPGKDGIAYSLGIDTNVDWDLDMAQRGFQVFQYDGSVAASPVEHEAFSFDKSFIGAFSALQPGWKSIPQILRENGHQERQDLILKMDIEGTEWAVLERLTSGEMLQFKQIILELHLEPEDIGRLPLYTALLGRLNRTHQVVHAHVNNNGEEVRYNGERFWYFFEVSYARRGDYRFKPSERWYPTELDAPCRPGCPDVQLGYFGMPQKSAQQRST